MTLNLPCKADTQQSNKFSAFMEVGSSSPYLQKPGVESHPEPGKYILRLHSYLFRILFLLCLREAIIRHPWLFIYVYFLFSYSCYISHPIHPS
jgi:hypothetical protein